MLESLIQDLRYSYRSLRRAPAFLATVVATLAVGIALITVAFTVVNAYVLRPYAVRHPERLHKVVWLSPRDGGPLFRWRDYEAIRDRRDVFDDVVAESTRFISSEGRPLAAALVSDNYFSALAPALMRGRGLGPDDGGAIAESVVLSERGWRRLFDGAPDVLGRTLDLNGRRFTVVGVVGPEFVGIGDSPRDVWVSFTTFAALFNPDLRGPAQRPAVEVFGVARAGVDAATAAAALTPQLAASLEKGPDVRAEVVPQPSANPLSAQMVMVLTPVFAAFALVLATACANVSNVMLARAISRHREIAVRLSLGARRSRIVRQLLTEAAVAAGLAAIAGVLLARWLLGAGAALVVGTLPPSVRALIRLAEMPLDGRVLLFAVAIAALTTMMFALAPALHGASLPMVSALRGQGGDAARGTRLRNLLVGTQVAVSLVLVVLAVTISRAAGDVSAIGPGYDTHRVLSINTRGDDHRSIPQLFTALAADPRVSDIAVTNGNPLFVRARDVAAAPREHAPSVATRYTFVSPGYFALLRIPVSDGRLFTADEARGGAPVAIVSAATASAFWPGESAVGQTIAIEPSGGRPVDDLPELRTVRVIGVVADAVSGLLVDGVDERHIYLPADERHSRAAALLVRPRADAALPPNVLEEVFRRASRDPDVFEALPLDEMRALQMYPLRAAAAVGSLLGGIALVLSVSGLYGVLSYALSQRRREIGIRIALGAGEAAVVRLMLSQSARLAGFGAVAGAAVAFVVLNLLDAGVHLRTVSLVDPAAFLAGLAIVGAATAVAAAAPARRAAKIEPAEVLRTDG